MRLDSFDFAILRVLREDARASLNDIGERVGLSTTPCWNRIKKMEASGVIQGYTVRIDPEALGFNETVIVQVTLDSHSEETLFQFGRELERIPEIMEVYLVSGEYDYHLRIAVKDTRDYERLLRERLYRLPGIRHSKSSFVLRTLKESPIPLPDTIKSAPPRNSKPRARTVKVPRAS
jgi:Lrp/AsnC family leucine-responsive transcriptional regulator